MIVALRVPVLSMLLLLLVATNAQAGDSLNGKLGYGELEVGFVEICNTTLLVAVVSVNASSKQLCP
jgi:hypothetical protein